MNQHKFSGIKGFILYPVVESCFDEWYYLMRKQKPYMFLITSMAYFSLIMYP